MHHTSTNRIALSATLHCLTGCAIGEVLGLVIGTALLLSNAATIGLAIILAFLFGYSLTMIPLVKSGLPIKKALGIALAADTLSIMVMEFVDNAVLLAIPGAMDASLTSWLFWVSLGVALAIAFLAAFPVNRYLIQKGKGHMLAHHHQDD